MDSTGAEVKNHHPTFHLFSEKLWLDLLDNSTQNLVSILLQTNSVILMGRGGAQVSANPSWIEQGHLRPQIPKLGPQKSPGIDPPSRWLFLNYLQFFFSLKETKLISKAFQIFQNVGTREIK